MDIATILHAPEEAENIAEPSLIEGLIGVPIPDYVLWIGIGVIVVFVVALVGWGFIKEMKKK